MIFSLRTQVEYIKRHFPVAAGDVLLTGTPPGVSAMQPGDEILARVIGPSGVVLSEGIWRVKGVSQ